MTEAEAWRGDCLTHEPGILPARVVVCLLLAGVLFAELGYSQVWQRLEVLPEPRSP